ncbi:MAG: hypothetical protein M2R45_04090 [Verrucomicrobia subdivision 3 bacterium]|nr:hypothetical protein [Limisphaerales bacterium]MCS1417029.1 hypothetical protein [Limisphaerales bacterium]
MSQRPPLRSLQRHERAQGSHRQADALTNARRLPERPQRAHRHGPFIADNGLARARLRAIKSLMVIAGALDKPLVIGDSEIPCCALEDKTRVLSQGDVGEYTSWSV